MNSLWGSQWDEQGHSHAVGLFFVPREQTEGGRWVDQNQWGSPPRLPSDPSLSWRHSSHAVRSLARPRLRRPT